MDKKEIIEKVKKAKEKAKQRKFKQSLEISVNFDNLDMESSENKLNLNVTLPKGRGKDYNIGIFADGDMNVRAKKVSKFVLNRSQLEEYAKDKRKMRKFANSCYAFLAQPDLMPLIGKSWGVVLGPRGKMPQPVPPNADLKPIFDKLRGIVRIRSKKNPTVHAVIGSEEMPDSDLAENILAVLGGIERQIPEDRIKSIYVKTTMGPSIRIE